ncbi:hypothetical protein J7K05_01560 [bacterium]|nr:hypothetical protein [bacterium]
MAEKYLIISTSDPDNNFLGIWEKRWLKRKKFKASQSERFFEVWKEFISNKDILQLSGVVVHQGAGSFSGLRLSSVVANALKIVFPALKLNQIIAKGVEDFVELAEREKWKRVENFILPKYPSPPKIG